MYNVLALCAATMSNAAIFSPSHAYDHERSIYTNVHFDEEERECALDGRCCSFFAPTDCCWVTLKT
jgi:hypothetical protein